MVEVKHKKLEKLKEELGKADLHMHSNFSDGKPSIDSILKHVESKTDLDVIAITDHDTIVGALYAQEIAAKNKYRFEIIIGEEISCKEGHLIGLFLTKKVEPKQTVAKALADIKSQGGIAITPHPLRHVRVNMGRGVNVDGIGLITLLKEKRSIDGLETINGTPTCSRDNIKATFVNNTLLFKSDLGGSDAHILDAIGKGYTLFEGKTAEELREAILNNQTQAMYAKWGFVGLIKYLFFFLPKGLRISINTLIHGRKKKRPQLVNCPRSYPVITKDIP